MLLERGRHAGYLVLTGPDGRQHAELGETEPVILTKRKIKEDVSESAVLKVGTDESATEEAEVKEAFYRLRFSDALFWNTITVYIKTLIFIPKVIQAKKTTVHVELEIHSWNAKQLMSWLFYLYIC